MTQFVPKAGGFARGAFWVLLLAVASCVSEVSAPAVFLWEADLQAGLSYPDASGSAAALSDGRVSTVSIAVQGLPMGSYPWEVRRGLCPSPGDLVGEGVHYAPLVIEIEGEPVSLERTLGAPMRSGREYHAVVLDPAGGPDVACGDFAER